MNFFEHQERSRKKSLLLVFLFGLAVMGIVAAVYAVIIGAAYFYMSKWKPGSGGFDFYEPMILFWIIIVTIAVVGIECIIKIISLRRGGRVIAESLGGRLISPGTRNLNEKKFLNIVEEMAIASGISVPLAYVLDNEPAINAFAAGYSPDDAVVTATAGCLNQLNREELQGVAAHEFSHILNGDMRLNIRLVGLISGIMVIGNIGKMLFKHLNRSVRGRMGLGAVLLGLALMIIGYIGVMVSRMIQCAVSRQREFLADASAVQFTRNPMGILGALKKIGGFNKGSAVISPNAGEISHMFFSSAVKTVFATHQPLKERIKRLDPSFSGEFKDELVFSPVDEAVMSVGGGLSGQAPAAPENVINQIGVLSGDQAKMAMGLLASIPATLKKELEDPLGACTVIYALLLSKDEEIGRAHV
jgi:Zn-dependent protease with chaperone function